jgi:hypothetical protein
VRSEAKNYGVTTEGDPFRIHFNQPDLRVYIFYHEEWNFTQEDLERLAQTVKLFVEQKLEHLRMSKTSVKIRFYKRSGHICASIN